jgi:hypothetical protein
LSFSTLLFIGIETPFRKFVLSLAANKRIIHSLLSCFCAKEFIAFIVLLCVVLAMFFLKPTTISKLDPSSVDAFIQSSSENYNIPSGVIFDDRYEVVAFRLHQNNEVAEIGVLLRATQDLWAHDTLALHLNNEKGAIIASIDQQIDFSRVSTPAGTYWVQKFKIPIVQFEQTFTFGLAMYITPAALFSVVGGDRDWDGKRLIIKVNH